MTYHSRDLAVSLQVLDNLGLVGRLDASEETRITHSVCLLRWRQVVKLAAYKNRDTLRTTNAVSSKYLPISALKHNVHMNALP